MTSLEAVYTLAVQLHPVRERLLDELVTGLEAGKGELT
jgi:hypothetical protein